jgi:hypothetical protein
MMTEEKLRTRVKELNAEFQSRKWMLELLHDVETYGGKLPKVQPLIDFLISIEGIRVNNHKLEVALEQIGRGVSGLIGLLLLKEELENASR